MKHKILTAKKTVSENKKKTEINIIVIYLAYILIGITAGIILKLFVIDIPRVQGISMEPTIHNNSPVLVNKLAYGLVKPFGDKLLIQWNKPKEGDIVIYLHDNNIIVKRCIATAGTPLEYSIESGYNLVVGNTKIPLTELQYKCICNNNSVPQNMILAIGDNFSHSIDSRTYGFIPERNILGKILCK